MPAFGQSRILAGDRLSANDPKRTLGGEPSHITNPAASAKDRDGVGDMALGDGGRNRAVCRTYAAARDFQSRTFEWRQLTTVA
jgi:hypothetical protein